LADNRCESSGKLLSSLCLQTLRDRSGQRFRNRNPISDWSLTMAKLTLSFKGRLLAVHWLDRPTLTIGRDPDCEIVIDSLAVAPRHAQIRQDGETFALVALEREHRVYRNGDRVEQATLAEGDMILVGKHTLSYSEVAPEAVLLARPPAPQRARSHETAESGDTVPVYLQIQSGPRLGHIVPLTRAVTRLTPIGGNEVIVTRRDRGYVLSRIGEANRVYVGRRALRGNEEVPLVKGCLVEVDGTRCQFFCRPGSPSPVGAPARERASAL
jgi:hypothetical protein